MVSSLLVVEARLPYSPGKRKRRNARNRGILQVEPIFHWPKWIVSVKAPRSRGPGVRRIVPGWWYLTVCWRPWNGWR